MNLIDEDIEEAQDEKRKKVFKIILISIAALILIAIILVIISAINNKNTLKFKIDEKNTDITSGLILMQDSKNVYVENNEIYISVKKLAANFSDVEFYNDEYKNKCEDTTKCYIKTSNEYTSYISNSSEIYKAVIVTEAAEKENNNNNTTTSKTKEETTNTIEYEYSNIENGVKYINGEIYASQSAIELGFNVRVIYNSSDKSINIYTLNYLEKVASQKVKLAVVGDDCLYTNKKLLKYGLVLIRNSDGDYGIANYNNYQEGNYMVSCKYSNIRFCESSSSIKVTTSADSKQGVLKIDLINKEKAEVKIEPRYQLIKQIDENLELYVVKENEKYGVISIAGDSIKTILKAEYQKIGIDGTLYNNMENSYIINGKFIPVKIDDKWGIASVDGNILVMPQYSGIGCNLSETGGSNEGVIVLPELVNGIDCIVFLVETEVDKTIKKSYSIINVKTGEKVGISADEIYSKYENNERIYYMKFSNDAGASMRNINIYKMYGVKVKETDKVEENTENNIVNNVVNNTVANDIVTNTVNNVADNTIANTTNN